MDAWLDPASTIEEQVRAIARTIGAFDDSFEPDVRVADVRFGDYQANGVLPYAKRNKTNPRQLGQTLMDALVASGVFEAAGVEISLAGPGFVNFTFSKEALTQWLMAHEDADAFGQPCSALKAGQKIVVDYSSPNTAKEMHVGHIRSTCIGHAIANLLEFAGADVIRDNHIGDWGTQFGMIIYGIKAAGYDLDADHEDPIADLEQFYKDGYAAYKSSEELAQTVRDELVKLQTGDPENVALWKKITEVSWTVFQRIYNQLGVQFDIVHGESYYRDQVDFIYGEMEQTGLSEVDQGAQVVFHPEHKRFSKQPFIIRKADGASNYATTDLATIYDRTHELKASGMINVVDSRQSDHFEQLFLTANKWYAARGWDLPEMKHVSFGTILGEDNKPLKSKEGTSVKLKDLIAEAIERCEKIVAEKNPSLSSDERRHIAEVVGVNAIRYVDLSQNRSTDYVFSWNKLLSFEGNTAPYLLYAVARINSIFRKLEEDPAEDFKTDSAIETDAERALARQLMGFTDAVKQSLSDLRPHFICSYLFELSSSFSSFYNADKVDVEDSEVRTRRLMLCQKTLQVLKLGLGILGIPTLERM